MAEPTTALMPIGEEPLAVEEMSLADSERRLRHLEARRALVLKTLNVTDVAKLGDALAKNKFAAEKLHEVFGGKFELLKDNTGRPLVDVQITRDDPDVGEVRIYTFFGRYTRPDGKVVEQMGSFSTKDAFFARANDNWKRIEELNVVDIMVAAQTETYKKCIFRGVGLGDWTGAEKQGLLGEAKGHDFKGASAGGARDSAIVMKFGKSKDKTIGELTDGDLSWYIKAYTENVADPDKSKYKASNQKTLEALKNEREGRKQPATEGKAEQPRDEGGKPDRGARQTKLFKRLSGHDVKIGDLLNALVPGAHSLTELTEAQLTELEAKTDDDFSNAATTLGEKEE